MSISDEQGGFAEVVILIVGGIFIGLSGGYPGYRRRIRYRMPWIRVQSKARAPID